MSVPRVSACLMVSFIGLVSVAGATVTALAETDEAAVPKAENPDHRAARRFLTSLVQGSIEDTGNAAGFPFVLFNDTVADAEDLSAALGELGKSRTFAMLHELDRKKDLRMTTVKTLQEPRLSYVAGRSFQPLALDGLSLVLVRAEGNVGGEKGVFDFVVAVKPGGDPQIVGVGDD